MKLYMRFAVEREQVAEVTGTNKDDSANAPIVRKSEKISRNALSRPG